MKAINYLKNIKTLDAKINTDIEELNMLRTLATKTTSVMGSERVQSSGSQQRMADTVTKIVEMQEIITKEIDDFVAFKAQAKAIIHLCEPDCITLLHKKYFLYETWENIAVEMGYTYKWVSGGLHSKALNQVQKILDQNSGKMGENE